MRNQEILISPKDLKHLCLIENEKLLNSNDGMPFPDDNPLNRFQNNFLVEELNYDREKLSSDLRQYLSTMNEDQN